MQSPCEREHRELHREMGHSVYSMELGCETKLPRTASSVASSRLPDVVTLGSGPFCSDTHCTMCHSESQLQDGSWPISIALGPSKLQYSEPGILTCDLRLVRMGHLLTAVLWCEELADVDIDPSEDGGITEDMEQGLPDLLLNQSSN